MSKKMTALIIMDGFGINPNPVGNAVVSAGTPNVDRLKAAYPHTQLGASGMSVGLPQSSALTKLATRPRSRPKGATSAIASPS